MRTSASLSLLVASGLLSLSSTAAAARPAEPAALRRTFNLRGGYTIVGNTLAQDCRDEVEPPLLPSALGACGAKTTDTGTDVLWTIQDANSKNLASTAILPGLASSRVTLALPASATVRHAQLYWAAAVKDKVADAVLAKAQLDRPGMPSGAVVAERTWSADRAGYAWYQSTADVTKLVQDWGAGGYDLSGVALGDFRNEDNSSTFAGFSLVVVFDDTAATASVQNITLFDGFDIIEANKPSTTTLSGFVAPSPVTKASLGVIAYEGDDSLQGDSLTLNGAALFNDENPAKNFFNSSRSTLGVPVSTAGDAPLLSGKADSMSGLDIDIVDVATLLPANATSAKIQAESSVESFVVGAYVFGIAVKRPLLDVVKNVDRSPARYLPGEKLRYEITITNTGSGPAMAPLVRDAVPAGLTYAGNLTLVKSATPLKALTGAVDGDEGQYDAATTTVTVQDAAAQLLPGETWIVGFDAKVNVGVFGQIDNSAKVEAKPLVVFAGEDPIAVSSHPPGSTGPTSIFVEECAKDGDCKLGVCDLAATPHVCVVGTAGSGGTAGAGGGTGGPAGAAGTSGSAGHGGTSGAGGDPAMGGQAGEAGQSGQAGFSGVAGTGGTGTSGTGGAAGKGGTGGAAGKGGTAGAAGKSGASGQTSAGTGGSAGKAGISGSGGGGLGGAAGAAGYSRPPG